MKVQDTRPLFSTATETYLGVRVSARPRQNIPICSTTIEEVVSHDRLGVAFGSTHRSVINESNDIRRAAIRCSFSEHLIIVFT